MSKETFTPHLWTYTDYLESTDREDTSESKQRWQEVVYILSTQYGEELQNVVSIIINHIDEEEIKWVKQQIILKDVLMPTVTESVRRHLAMVHIDAQDIPLVKDVTKLV